MTSLAHCRTGLTIAALLAASSGYAATLTKADYGTARDRIGTDYQADQAACSQSSGNARDVCHERASGRQKVALAELEYRQSGSAADANKLAVANADASYSVAHKLCDSRAGQAKELCITEADTVHNKALADATLNRKVGAARVDAADDKREADFKLATEKCDSLAGDTKARCVSNAKLQFGKV